MSDSIDFVPDDRWAVRVLKAKGDIYLTDWGKETDYGPEFMPCVPEIEATKLLPNGDSVKVGVLGDTGIFDVVHDWPLVKVIEIASWSEIEVLPEWESSNE